MAYEFEGYWKDVGTINSLWEANMDLLGETARLQYLRLRRPEDLCPELRHAFGLHRQGSEISDSFVAEGCEVFGTVHHSIISTGCTIGKGRRNPRQRDYAQRGH